MKNDRADIWWAPRGSLFNIRALYLSSAGGIYDDELIDDVGTSLSVYRRQGGQRAHL